MIKTERLIIRPFIYNDLSDFIKLLEIDEVPGWKKQRENPEGFLAWHISKYKKIDIINDIVCFGIFEAETGEILGAVGAGEHDSLHETEIFYNLLKEKRGMGYATEAASAVTRWALTGFDIPYIAATADVENIESQRVLERCGYKFINEQVLMVKVTSREYRFKYYRYYFDGSKNNR